MKRLRANALYLIGVLLLGGCATQRQGAVAPHPDDWQETNAPLELMFELEKSRVVLGEPVYVGVRLANRGARPILVQPLLHPKFGYVHVKVTAPDGRVVGYAPLAVLDHDNPPQTLAPGAEAGTVFPVFYGARGWTFSEPGSYRLRAFYRDPTQPNATELSSNPVELTVTQGGDEGRYLIDQGAASSEAGKFLLWMSGDHLRKGITHLQSTLERNPESPLSDYVNLALGHNLSRSFKNYSANRLRPPDYRGAIGYLERVRTETLPRYLQIRKLLVEARCFVGLMEFDRARSHVAQARERIGAATQYAPLLDQVADIEARLK